MKVYNNLEYYEISVVSHMPQSKKRQFPSSGVSTITMCSRDALFPKTVKCSRISADITGLNKCC